LPTFFSLDFQSSSFFKKFALLPSIAASEEKLPFVKMKITFFRIFSEAEFENI